jgi:hypothetical protein
MTRRSSFLIAALVGIIALYFVVLRVAPAPDRRKAQKVSPAPTEELETIQMEGGVEFQKPGPYPTEYDEVTVTIEIPPASEFPVAWATTHGCPHNRLTGALGAMIGPGNGCPVLVVEPDGPAAKAGIQPLDRLGEPGDCASALYYAFRPRKEARSVEWTVRRPKGAKSESAEAEGAAS